ncbi:MAG: SRPBCC family protein [Candidatus Dormibacteraceae bacterium]
MNTDSIEKNVLIRAPGERVWQALADTKAFGQWFGMELTGSFAPGACVKGRVTHQGYEHVTFEIVIEKMEPERLFSWRWHPYAVEPSVDYSSEPTTLVTFGLQEGEEGTLLTVVESGFDSIPLTRRAEAYRKNEEGWAQQMEVIERYVVQPT